VPEGLSVVGFDDTAIAARLWPPLTTLRVPYAEMAGAATLQLIHPDGAPNSPGRFAPEFVARGSTGACPT